MGQRTVTVLYFVRKYVGVEGRVVNVEMIGQCFLGIGWTILFRPVHIFTQRGGFGLRNVKVGDFEPLAVVLNGHVTSGDMNRRVERIEVIDSEFTGTGG